MFAANKQTVYRYIICNDSFEFRDIEYEIGNYEVDGCGARAIMEYDYKNCHIAGHKVL